MPHIRLFGRPLLHSMHHNERFICSALCEFVRIICCIWSSASMCYAQCAARQPGSQTIVMRFVGIQLRWGVKRKRGRRGGLLVECAFACCCASTTRTGARARSPSLSLSLYHMCAKIRLTFILCALRFCASPFVVVVMHSPPFTLTSPRRRHRHAAVHCRVCDLLACVHVCNSRFVFAE